MRHKIAVVLLAVASVALSACASVTPKAACAVIDVACSYVSVRVVQPDGTTKDVVVPVSVVQSAATRYESQKGSEK